MSKAENPTLIIPLQNLMYWECSISLWLARSTKKLLGPTRAGGTGHGSISMG